MACRRVLARRTSQLRVLLWLGCALASAATPLSAQYFGQNKVPWRAKPWQVLTTQHCRLHYADTERDYADQAARVAERGYARLSRIYAHEVRQPIPIILYGSQSEFRETRAVATLLGEETGGLTEFYKRRVIVPSTGSLAELDHVLTHELAHAFQLDILQRTATGRPIEPLSWTPPLWVMEGLSEYLSMPGVDTNTEMWLRDAVLTGNLPDLQQLELVGDIRVYRFGQAAVAHVAARFGDGVLGPWLRAMARHRSVARATSEVLGMSLDKLSEDWQDALRRRYLPELALGRDPEEVARRLTDHRRSLAGFHVTPAVSPDGLEMVYVADQTPYADLYVASALDGSHRTRLIRGERRESFESLRYARTSIEWSPDGTRIALVARTGDRDRLTLFDVRRKRVVRSFDFGFDEMLSPTWSPDGRDLVFVGLRGGWSNLYRVTAEGDSLRPLLDGRWGVFQPAWSPDGGRIAFVTDGGRQSFWADSTQASWEIGILDLRSGAVERLAAAEGKSLNPQWLPDGRHLLYLSDRTGIANVFVRDLEGGRDYPLTDVRTGVSGITATSAALSVSRNGRRLVFSVFADTGWDLFAIQDPLSRLASAQAWSPAEPSRGEAPWLDPPAPVAPLPMEAGLRDSSEAAPETATGDSTETGAESDLWTVVRETAALPETLQCRQASYRPQLSLDYVQAGGLYASGYGAVGQVLLGFSDILGDRQILVGADVSGSLEEGDYVLGVVNQRRRTTWSASAYQYVVGYGIGTAPGYPEIYQKRLVRGIGFGLTYPISHFRRIELLLDAVWERRYDWSCAGEELSQLWICGWEAEHRDRYYLAPEVAWVYDSALFGPTGPLSGRRTRLSGGLFVGGREARGFELDHRVYANIRKSYALAWRTVVAGEWGPDRQAIAFGGPYSLHGYADRPLVGTTIAFTNVEFRFPFVETLGLAWPLRIRFFGIRGALFFDLGGAWDDPASFRAIRSGRGQGPFRLEDLRAACGARAGINLGFTVLRWEISRRTDLSRWVGKPTSEVSLGWEF